MPTHDDPDASWRIGWCIAAAMMAGCGPDQLYVVSSTPSPNGQWVADWYVESGGGAAAWASDQVSIRRSTERFRPGSHVVFSASSSDRIRVTWRDDRHLEIRYPRANVLSKSERSFGGIQIECREDVYR